MKTLLISMLFSLTSAHAASPAQDHYEYLKGTEYKIELSRSGSGLQRLIFEKSSRNEICQKAANGRPWNDFVFSCYTVSEVGTTARDAYENDASEELNVLFTSTNGTRVLLNAAVTEKQSRTGFCRKSVGESQNAVPYYLCYELAR